MNKIRVVVSREAEVGFYSYVQQVICALWSSEKDGIPLVVDFSRNHRYIDKPGENVWDNYFEQPYGISLQEAIERKNRNEVELIEDEWFKNEDVNRELIGGPLLDETVRKKAAIGAKRIKPIGETKEIIDSYYNDNMKGYKILGVHKRSGQIRPTHEERIITFIEFFGEIDKHIDKFDKIYLATNVIDEHLQFVERYGDKVLFRNVTRVPFLGEKWKDILDCNTGVSKFKLGQEVIIDCFLLSKTDLLIKNLSGISINSCFLNSNLPYIELNKKFYN